MLNQKRPARTEWKESAICTKSWNNSVLQFVKVSDMCDPEAGFLHKCAPPPLPPGAPPAPCRAAAFRCCLGNALQGDWSRYCVRLSAFSSCISLHFAP